MNTKNTKKVNLKKVFKEVEILMKTCMHVFALNKKKRNRLRIINKGIEGKATEVDVFLERYLIKELKAILPSSLFLSEEENFLGRNVGLEQSRLDFQKVDYGWLIDPIDGTNNFINGLDHFVISVALVQKGETIGAWVLNPMRGFFYLAYKGKGSFLSRAIFQGKDKVKWNSFIKIKPSFTPLSLQDAVLSTTNVHSAHKEEVFQLYHQITEQVRSTRKLGSAAHDLCYCAEGILDGFWQKGLKPWDTAAAYLICREAGLKVTDYFGRPYDPWCESILVSSPKLHDQLKALIKKFTKTGKKC